MEVKDALNREWIDISSEMFRSYTFADGGEFTVSRPQRLNVSNSGGHRILDSMGVSHYVPSGWLAISWEADPHFVA